MIGIVYNSNLYATRSTPPHPPRPNNSGATALHERANLFNSTKLNFPLTASCSAIQGVLLSVTYGRVWGGVGVWGGVWRVGGGGRRAENVNRNSKCEREGLPN